jgi:glycosyltransferase involved in cell wall biosynthesis
VLYAHRATPGDQARAGFGVEFDWDTDLQSGYEHRFLNNVASQPSLNHFFGCDTPEVGKCLREGQFDAVLVQGWHLKCYVQAMLASKMRGLPLLVRGDSQLGTPRSISKRIVKAALFPAFLRFFDAALYVGTRSHAYWAHYGFPKDRLFYSPHCVDTEWFSARATPDARREVRERLGIDSAAKVVLFVGKLVPFKRPLDVLNAAAQLKKAGQELEVVVAGAGALNDEMREVAKMTAVKVHFLGFCNQTEMPKIYAASDVLVLPSDGRETWGLVANEAIACGRPVVLADTVGSAQDIAADETAGLVFPVGDVGALANALTKMFSKPPTSQKIEKKSTQHSIAAAVGGIEEALQRFPSTRAPN